LGPARLGTTVARSSFSVEVNSGTGASGVQNRPCALQYASTSATCSLLRPDFSRKRHVSASTGKKPIVAPYSGAMLAIVARSASDIAPMPLP
jgi:hypothetical protein